MSPAGTIRSSASPGVTDSRLVIAGFHKFGVRFETMTWQSTHLSAKEQDLIQKVIACVDAPHRYINSHIDPPIERVAQHNSGGYRKPDDTTIGSVLILGNLPQTVFISGLGAEIMRGFFNLWPSAIHSLAPSEMARRYFNPRGSVPKGTVEMFEGYFRRGNYGKVKDWGFDPNDIFYWEHRMGMWKASVANEFDVATRSIPAFNSRVLFTAAFGLPPRQRLTKELLLTAIARFICCWGTFQFIGWAEPRAKRDACRGGGHRSCGSAEGACGKL